MPDDARGVLSQLDDERIRQRMSEARQLELILQWATLHPTESIVLASCFDDLPVPVAGLGAPMVAEFCIPELAATLGMSTDAGKALLGEVVELAHRLPRCWRAVLDLEAAAWRARKVARATIPLIPEAAAYVDRQAAAFLDTIGPAQLDRLITEAKQRYMPEHASIDAESALERRGVTIDTRADEAYSPLAGTAKVYGELDLPDALDLDAALSRRVGWLRELGSTETSDVLRAKALGEIARADLSLDLGSGARSQPTGSTTLYVHLTPDAFQGADGIARIEQAQRIVTTDTLRAWLQMSTAPITVKPVIDLDGGAQVTQYEVPDRMREAVQLRDVTCVFPWCSRPARGCDVDHVKPYAEGGPTTPENLACLCRRHHRLKTHSRWSYAIAEPGGYLWRSPHGHTYLRDRSGTRALRSS